MKKKAAEVKTVGDLVVEGILAPSAEEATHVYDVETEKIEKIEVTPPAKPKELERWELGELNEKWAKDEIICCLTERRNLYVAHKEDCKVAYLNKIHFYKPFLSPVQLYADVKLELPGLIPYNFDWAVYHLVQEGKIGRVSEDTYTCDHPNDFREARIGDVFLNTPELTAAYERSVSLRQAEEALTDGERTAKVIGGVALPPLVEEVKDADYFLGR